jgi:hypothetical protein
MPGTLSRSYREVTSDLKPGTPLFISDYKPLPADGPWNTPHIIDLGEYNQIPNTYQNNVMLWDAVASTVFHSAPWFSSRSLPEVLNPSNDIKAVQFVKDRDDGTKLIIARCSNAVMVSLRELELLFMLHTETWIIRSDTASSILRASLSFMNGNIYSAAKSSTTAPGGSNGPPVSSIPGVVFETL